MSGGLAGAGLQRRVVTYQLEGPPCPRGGSTSHIKPWAKCATYAERLDVYNGLLLAPNLDAAFDAGLISFRNNGAILMSRQLDQPDRDDLRIDDRLYLRRVSTGHLLNLAWHRTFLFESATLSGGQ